ncbi:MAG: D-aminoacylase [Alphaproteobacteria bacterium]|nr:D-aminoacylase [Alphaproteobacteria bacterium]MBV9373983.1 D-aminoacylase [Alphaproteobacteria bacterium]
MSCDILIRGGTLIDGSGRAGEIGGLAVLDGRIAALGRSLPQGAAKVIDAEGLAVAPGFIDIKTHSDFTLPINPKAESKVRQGVTTEIIGHCGFSVAPVLPGKAQLLADYLSGGAPWLPFREMRFPEYLDTFPPVAVNTGMLVGHNTLRLMVMGLEDRAPRSAELSEMIALLEEGLSTGALGMSSGLFTPPGSFAQPSEILAFGPALKQHNAAYFTHIRDESNKVLEAAAEAIEFARAIQVHVEIVHLKCSGTDNWGKAAQILGLLDQARAAGCDIDCDAYPYTAGANPLKNLLPPWVQIGGLEAMLACLAQPETREQIRREIDRDGLNNWGRIPSWEAVQISVSPRLPQHAGETIAALAAARGRDPVDLVCDYLIEDNGATRVLITSIAEEDIREILRSPKALVGSDGNCVADYGVVGQAMPHPRFYGTFPRIIGRYVHEQQLLPLERAIHKMTGATARALRLRDRGLLKEGYRADIAIFDPADFKDRATYADPHQYPSGDRTTVLVNGTIVVDNARHTGATPGMVLRRAPDGTVG